MYSESGYGLLLFLCASLSLSYSVGQAIVLKQVYPEKALRKAFSDDNYYELTDVYLYVQIIIIIKFK